MPQTRESGAAGVEFGKTLGKAVAKLIGAKLLSDASNECELGGTRAVIKCAKHGTSAIGITAPMLPRLERIIAALFDEGGNVAIYEVNPTEILSKMEDSRSSGHVGGKIKKLSRTAIRTSGRLMAQFSSKDVTIAAAHQK